MRSGSGYVSAWPYSLRDRPPAVTVRSGRVGDRAGLEIWSGYRSAWLYLLRDRPPAVFQAPAGIGFHRECLIIRHSLRAWVSDQDECDQVRCNRLCFTRFAIESGAICASFYSLRYRAVIGEESRRRSFYTPTRG